MIGFMYSKERGGLLVERLASELRVLGFSNPNENRNLNLCHFVFLWVPGDIKCGLPLCWPHSGTSAIETDELEVVCPVDGKI